jgi:hypothetical protein
MAEEYLGLTEDQVTDSGCEDLQVEKHEWYLDGLALIPEPVVIVKKGSAILVLTAEDLREIQRVME